MKNILVLVLSFTLLLTISCKKKEEMRSDVGNVEQMYSSMEKVWSTKGDLKVPESVMYDEKNNILYVSNINGKPTEKNGMGFISKLFLDGKVKELMWIKNLNAPKGMGIIGNNLYVTDIDRLHIIDIPKGKITKTISVKNAVFLNDIAVDSKGFVYVTDMLTGSVHRLNNGKIETWLDLKKYERPNGLFIHEENLYIGTSAGIIRCNIVNKSIDVFIENIGGIDGIKLLDNKLFIVSDWKGKVQIISKDKKAVILGDTSQMKINAADFEFIKDSQMIYVPTFFNNKIDAYKLK